MLGGEISVADAERAAEERAEEGDGSRRLYSSGLIVRTPSALNKDG